MLLLAGLPTGASAQLRFPSEERPELPEIEEPEAPEFVLPPLPEPSEEDRGLAAGPSVQVSGYRFVGNTVFADAELEQVLAPFTNRRISSAEIPRIRDAVTLHYVEQGYVNSGAVIPDQQVRDGVVEVHIIEGRLERIEVTGERYYRAGVLRRRLERAAATPLRIDDLEREVRILQEDRRVAQIHAELHPGSGPGDGVLEVRVEERSPYLMGVDFSNREPPSIGAERGRVRLAHENALGFGDILAIDGSLSEGLWESEARYEIPVNRWRTSLGGHVFFNASEVVTNPFKRLDVESESRTYGLSIRQPLYHVPGTELSMSLIGEWRQSETWLRGIRTSFAPGPDRGRSTVSVLRLRHDLLHRDSTQVIALRSQISGGLDVLGATTNRGRRSYDDSGGEVPDGRFVSWLGQFQWIRRYTWDIETLVRADVQLSNDPLLSLERFAVGGADSVRGYRENQAVRDQGVVFSIEGRVPLWRDQERGRYLQLAPFFDVGHSWNQNRETFGPRTLPGIGMGLRIRLSRWIQGELYAAKNLRDVDVNGDDLQDLSLHFRIGTALVRPWGRR